MGYQSLCGEHYVPSIINTHTDSPQTSISSFWMRLALLPTQLLLCKISRIAVWHCHLNLVCFFILNVRIPHLPKFRSEASLGQDTSQLLVDRTPDLESDFGNLDNLRLPIGKIGKICLTSPSSYGCEECMWSSGWMLKDEVTTGYAVSLWPSQRDIVGFSWIVIEWVNE